MIKKLIIICVCFCLFCAAYKSFAMELKDEQTEGEKIESKQNLPKVEYSYGKYPDSINGSAKIFYGLNRANVILIVSKNLGDGDGSEQNKKFDSNGYKKYDTKSSQKYLNSDEFSCKMWVRGSAGVFSESEKIDYPEIVEELKKNIIKLEDSLDFVDEDNKEGEEKNKILE